MDRQPLLSIIFTSYTTERLSDIYELLQSIKSQTYPNIEAIFVVEGSQTLLSQVKLYASKNDIRNLNLIYNDAKPGLSAARNLGISQAKGDIIAFVDDDTVLFDNWAEEMVKTYEDDSVIGVTGPAIPLWEDESVGKWFPNEFYWIIGCTAWHEWKGVNELRNAWGQGMSFRKEAFKQAGIFSTEIGFNKGEYRHGLRTLDIGDDVEFSLRVRMRTKKRIVGNSHVQLWHRVHSQRLGWKSIAKRAYWVGRSRHLLKQSYPNIGVNNKNSLAQEQLLLKHIVINLAPNILRTFITHPLLAWYQLRLTVIIIFFITSGYFSIILPKS